MKKMLSLTLCFAMLLSLLTSCGAAPGGSPSGAGSGTEAAPQPDDTATYELIIATHVAEDHPVAKALFMFRDLCEERSNGRLTFKTYVNQELGDAFEVIDQLRMGVIDGGIFTVGHMASYNDKLNATMWPYMFESYDHAASAYAGPVGDYMKEMAADAGFTVLDWMYYGFRNLSSNRPVHSVSDIKGLKLRVPTERVNQLTMSAYGATCVTIAFNELYLALSNGTVDGQENPIATISSGNLQEVNKYIAMLEYTFFTSGFVMNPDSFNSLPEDLQLIIREASAEAAAYEREIFVDDENAIVEQFKEQGVTFTYPDKEECRQAAQPALDELKKDYDGEFVEKWLKLIEDSRV